MIQPFLAQIKIAATTFCGTGGSGAGCQTGLPHVQATTTQLHEILQILFGVIGALSVLFVVIGGLRFVASDGDPQDAARARNTIIYALVGLVLSISAEAIVAFVLSNNNL